VDLPLAGNYRGLPTGYPITRVTDDVLRKESEFDCLEVNKTSQACVNAPVIEHFEEVTEEPQWPRSQIAENRLRRFRYEPRPLGQLDGSQDQFCDPRKLIRRNERPPAAFRPAELALRSTDLRESGLRSTETFRRRADTLRYRGS
jgi:hypothetical protein